MSQQDKAAYFRQLKEAGVEFTKHYREYTTEELRASVAALQQQGVLPGQDELPYEQPVATQAGLSNSAGTHRIPDRPAPLAPRNPNELPGQRLNSKEEDEPIRTDEQGRVWFQEEVAKPAFAKPRGRRVLKYNDPGVVRQTAKSGDYIESFEIGGDKQVPSEVKVTLPSYQVGIYKDPRFPFKIHTYNGVTGFDLFEVQEFYGGAELVPEEVKRKYVENVLCYDIRTTVRAIESEHRRLQLAGKA